MTRCTCNIFIKIYNLFGRRSDPSHSSPLNVNVSSAGPPSVLPPPTPPSFGSVAFLPHNPSPAISPSQPPDPPSQLATPPPTIPPPLSEPLQPASCSVNHVPSDMTLTSSSYHAPSPANLLLLPPTLGPAPRSSLPPASRTLTPQFGESTNFAGAHDFNMYHPQFNDFSLAGSGIDKLLKNSMPDAFYNSAARYPPPKCHLGTRTDYIAQIMDWALGDSDRHEPILWLRGPFGVGKSAVAQSCAEALQLKNKLVATLFFSRSNADRDDPRRVFTSIAYQISAICELLSNIVDARIRKDPAVATKSLSTQFEELLVRPLSQVDVAKSRIGGCVVIIDGLDECRGTSEQCEIIRVIATSIQDQTTPFRWFITSRPEDPIIRTMNSDTVFPISFHLELPVSRKIDHEILIYLTDEFGRIRKHYRLADSWPPEEVLALLVDRTAGLWIYVTTIVRFITDESGFGPEDQLRIVLEFLADVSANIGVDNPLTEMDFFYTLIMQRIPPKIRIMVQKICLLRSVTHPWDSKNIVGVLGLSEDQFRRSCASIQSVVELRGSDLDSMSLHFYHVSFLDFMRDSKRSKELCIYGDFLTEYRKGLLDWLHQVCSRSTGPGDVVFPLEPVLFGGQDRNEYYLRKLNCFWDLCGVANHPFDSQTAASLGKLRFQMMLRLMGGNEYYLSPKEHQHLRDNLPAEARDKIIREGKCPTLGCTNPHDVWIFGHSENETVATYSYNNHLTLENNQDPLTGRCSCGFKIQIKPGSVNGHEEA